MAESKWTNTCCNPFGLPNHTCKRKGLRPVADWMCDRAPVLLGSKICDSCRKKLAKVNVHPDSEPEAGMYTVDTPEVLTSLNQCLDKIGETPICKWKLRKTQYSQQKIEKLTTAMKKAMRTDTMMIAPVMMKVR